MIEGPLFEIVCQISSVTKGMKGCMSSRLERSTVIMVSWAASLAPRVVLAVEGRLDELQVPVAEFLPDETVEMARGIVEAVLVETLRHLGNRVVEPRPDPPVGERVVLLLHGDGTFGVALEVHHAQAGGIPDLVDEVLVALDPLLGHADVAALGGEGGQREPEGVGAELVDHLQGVDDVALGLAHLVAVHVAHQRVQVDILEGHVLHDVEAHHHHAGHPEEEDVEPGDEKRSWGRRS